MQVICNKNEPPLGLLIAIAHCIENELKISLEWSDKENKIVDDNGKVINCTVEDMGLRVISRMFNRNLDPIESTELDYWLCSAGDINSSSLPVLNQVLATRTYLVGNQFTIADCAVFVSLYNAHFEANDSYTHICRWYNNLTKQSATKYALDLLSSMEMKNSKVREGKFIELPGAEMGQVVVRFPPEASGYLHIGHAKAALLNQHYQQSFNGKLILRFDDTNPSKENVHFEHVILEDIRMLKIQPDQFTYTSDYFDKMLEFCEQLLKDGKAYVDDTSPELMKQQREQQIESTNRENSFESNLLLWNEMKSGTTKGQQCCVRAKINMKSLNGCLRDPTIYRCKSEPHPRTGTKYKVYPTYDFACPIVDAIEGVTHTLRTMEYHDRDEQFYWFIEALKLRRPHIWEFSRLSMTHTVLSKRKLTWFVEKQIVDGWDDPRMPTVRGVLRRGMTVEGLREFIISQGSSRSVVFMNWDKIWAFNKKIIDAQAPRYTALMMSHVPVHIENVDEFSVSVQKHPKDPSIGFKNQWTSSIVLINRSDADNLMENTNATFINWGNILIKSINRDNGRISQIQAVLNVQDTDYKKTLKISWLPVIDKSQPIPICCVYFDHLISKALLGKDEDFKTFINTKTMMETQMLGESEMKHLRKNDIIQIQRVGFFRVDVAYEEFDLFTCKEQSLILFHIPDGHTKNETSSTVQHPMKQEKLENIQTKSISSNNADEVAHQITEQGNFVRELKAKKVEKSEIDDAVKKLLLLKELYKNVSGKDWVPLSAKSNESTQKSSTKKAGSKVEQKTKSQLKTKQIQEDVSVVKKQTRLGLEVKKEDNLSEWYQQVITKAELIEYYDVSGCYIFRPWAFAIWEIVREWFDIEIKKLGVENCYFPMFVSRSALEKEQAHIADFAPEVAWVTKSGDTDMAEPIAIRPTSETIMYPAYAKWIQSYRDLPIKLNQWNNVVRWEFKHPQPFLRTREFLWQEGHSAFAHKMEANTEVMAILELYAKIYNDLLAIPVVKGHKTEKEKFAGGEYTLTVEAYIAASGRAIQGATSHHLGQNFSKMFDIIYEDPDTKEKQYVYQNSWGITTRIIGVMIMVHSDNQGLVLPPAVANVQIIIIPCGLTVSLPPEIRNALQETCLKLEENLKISGLRVKCDLRSNYSPGWKFNHWELKGVPIRIEIGPKDLEQMQLVAVRRDTGDKITFKTSEAHSYLTHLLDSIQSNLLHRATIELDSHIVVLRNNWDQFINALDKKNLILTPFCGRIECEDSIKTDSTREDDGSGTGVSLMGAKSLCIPFKQPHNINVDTDHCIHPKCTKSPQFYVLFGRSY